MVEEEKEIEGKTRSVKRKKEGGRRSKKGGETSLSYLSDEVDGHALAPETTRAPDAVQVVLRLRRQVVVDDEGDLARGGVGVVVGSGWGPGCGGVGPRPCPAPPAPAARRCRAPGGRS